MTPSRLFRGIVFRIEQLLRYRLIKGPLTYDQDGLATQHNCDFIVDPLFMEAYRLAEATGSFGGSQVHWRAFVACWAAERATSLPGDFVECGTNKGGLARAIFHFVNFAELPKRFYLLDTFSGLVDKYITDEERSLGRRAGGYEECFDAVQKTFAPFPNVVLVRGPVPDTLPQVTAEKIAFLSIDMNCAPPEIAAAEYFWDRLSSGAAILLDDYGWPGHIVQKRAFDRFAEQRGVRVLALPTGQGLLFKP
jgi:hypothetical protein